MPSLVQIQLITSPPRELENMLVNSSLKLTNLTVMSSNSRYFFLQNDRLTQYIWFSHERQDSKQYVMLHGCHIQGAFEKFLQI